MLGAPKYNFAVFTEVVYGKRHWQGYGLAPGLAGREWLPVNDPQITPEAARLDCVTAHKAVIDAGKQMPLLLDPNVQTWEWSGTRRILK